MDNSPSSEFDPSGDNEMLMDEVDRLWIGEFLGNSIPEDAIVEGFISIISWVNPDGSRGWRSYNTLDQPLSSILGLMEMAKFTLMNDNREDTTNE